MKPIIMKYFREIVPLLALLLGFQASWAADPGVLHLKKNEYNSYVNLGIDLKNDLISNAEKGNAGEATIEFWVKSTQNGNEWTLTDLLEDAQTFSMSMRNNNILDLRIKGRTTSVDLGSAVSANTWYHVALVINENGTEAQLLINGQGYGNFSMDFSDNVVRDLYFYKDKTAEVYLTEVRFWAARRSALNVDKGRWQPYVKKTNLILELQAGLVVLYADYNQSTSQHSKMTDLTTLSWADYLNGGFNATFISDYNAPGGNESIATVFKDPGHPILSNKQIFMTASKGNEPDAYKNQVILSWSHLEDATGYDIIKTDLTNNQITRNTITYDGNPDVNYRDAAVIPGRLYDYQVSAIGVNGSIAGNDKGFVYYNGRLSGRITSQVGSKPIQDVKVAATPQVKSGSALQFTNSNQQINVYNVDAFRKNNDFTLTFWYKSSTGGSSVNGIFQLGTTQIRAAGDKMQVYKSGSMVMETTIPDSDWHHYAVVFANTGTIYIDAQIGDTFNNPSPTDLSSAPAGNVYAFEINYATGNDYWLDELRLWDWNLTDAQSNLEWYHDAYVSGEEDDLLFNYRFDMQDTRKVFNMTANSRGDSYTGETDGTLTWTTSSSQQVALAYKGLSDANGDYVIESIDHNQDAGLTFDIVPFKAIPGYPSLFHEFDPATEAITFTYQSDKVENYQIVHDMIDISQMPVSGLFYYYEPNETNSKIPAPMGVSMMIDGVPQSEDQFLSDINGNYLLYSALGDKVFKVNNPDVRFYGTGSQSLNFDGESAYAKVASIPNADGNKGTWTGWIKKSSAENTNQTILNIGDGLELVLNGNQNLVVQDLTNSSEVVRVDNALSSTDWVFFALTYDGAEVTLRAGNSERKVASATTSITGTALLLGIHAETGAENTAFKGHLDQLEYRDDAYDAADIALIETGGIVAKDDQYLQLSYSFAGQDSVYRAISRTSDSHERVMMLHGATKTQLTSYTYQKDYKTNYVPANDEASLGADAADESYSTVVLTPKSNLDFEITNRYGFTGHIQTPCGYGAGRWAGTIERTDLPAGYTFEKNVINFDTDSTVFHVDGLVPGFYKVKLVNQEDGRELENFETIKIDSADYVYDFEWKNPLSGSMKIYAASSSGEYDSLLSPLCTSIYELESGVAYELELESFEMYNAGQCMIDEIEYTASGDLGASESYTGVITENGMTRMLFTAGTPNYSDPTTPRKFTVTLTRTGGIVEKYTTNVEAYVTGSEMSSPNFTIVNPEIMTVLHDPPGDNSTITLNAGTAITHKTSHTLTGGVDANFGVTFGNEFNNSVLVGGMVGGVINQLLKSRIEVTISANVKHTEGGEWTTTHTSTINSSISTNGGQDIVGEDADVFIGRGQIMTIGTGRKIEVNGCVPELSLNREIVKFDYTTPFYYTATGIEGVLQNQLSIIVDDPNSSAQDIADAQAEYDKWMTILTDNVDRIDDIDNAPSFTDAFFSGHESVEDPDDFSITGDDQFSFGGKVTIGIDVKTTESDQNTYNNSTTIGTGYESKSDIAALGFLAQLKSTVKLSVEHKYSDAYTDDEVRGYSIKLLDDEVYDHFSVTWKKDPKYGTPMFKTFAGQSKCPYESGTENREGLEMIALGSTDQTTAVGQQIDYQLKLTNTQLAIDNQKKSYTLSIDNASNNSGVTILFNGNPFTEGQSFSLPKDGTATPVISVISTQAVEEELTLKFASSCEASGGSLLFSDDKLTNAKLRATLTLMARFQAPCVEEITMASPVDNHVVTSASNDIIPFRFKLTNPLAGLTDMRVEYRESGSSVINVLNTIVLNVDNKDVQDYYNYNVNVAALQDKKDYEFRLSPACTSGTGTWGMAQTPSDWIAIKIDKEVPTIINVTPTNNTEWTSGPIAVTYSKTLSTVVPNNIVVDMVKDDVVTNNITKSIAVSNNQLVITPTYLDKDLEGGVITVTIPAGEVKDTYGNPAAAFSWSFLANKNVVSWEAANKQLTGPQGTTIPFSMSIQNDGVVNSTYKLVNIPTWLTSTNRAPGDINTLYGSGYTDRVDFSVSSALLAGTYQHIVQAETPGGVESFRLEVIVTEVTVSVNITEVNPSYGRRASEQEEEQEEDTRAELESALNLAKLSLSNYPNPFTDATTIAFELPEASQVQLVIFDMMGKHVKTLVNEERSAGSHEVNWSREGEGISKVTVGTYIVKMNAGGKSVYHRLVVK